MISDELIKEAYERQQKELFSESAAANRPDVTDDPHNAQHSPEPPSPARRHIPGRSRPQVLKSYMRLRSEGRPSDNPAHQLVWDAHHPEPEKLHFWRVEIGCGCFHELFTSSKDELPAEQEWLDGGEYYKLRAGYLVCFRHGLENEQYRVVETWGDRSRTINVPDDPVEPKHGIPQDIWDEIRKPAHKLSELSVTLSCGHRKVVRVQHGWTAAMGHTYLSAEEVDREREIWKEANPDWPASVQEQRIRTLHLLDFGNPEPPHEYDCNACRYQQPIVAFHHVGPLVARNASGSKKGPRSSGPLRETLEQRLAETEAAASKIREQLKNIT